MPQTFTSLTREGQGGSSKNPTPTPPTNIPSKKQETHAAGIPLPDEGGPGREL